MPVGAGSMMYSLHVGVLCLGIYIFAYLWTGIMRAANTN